MPNRDTCICPCESRPQQRFNPCKIYVKIPYNVCNIERIGCISKSSRLVSIIFQGRNCSCTIPNFYSGSWLTISWWTWKFSLQVRGLIYLNLKYPFRKESFLSQTLSENSKQYSSSWWLINLCMTFISSAPNVSSLNLEIVGWEMSWCHYIVCIVIAVDVLKSLTSGK